MRFSYLKYINTYINTNEGLKMTYFFLFLESPQKVGNIGLIYFKDI